MSIGAAIRVLEGLKRSVKPGCDIDRALTVALKELNEKKQEKNRIGKPVIREQIREPIDKTDEKK